MGWDDTDDDEGDLVEKLFAIKPQKPTNSQRLSFPKLDLDPATVIAVAAGLVSLFGRVAVQHFDHNAFRAPLWSVAIAAIAVLMVAHRLYHSYVGTPYLWPVLLCVVAIPPLADLALAVPVGILVILFAVSTQ